ncbi:MarR family winged helix-turn-helix transcriptional regulator [Leucobacter sp. NPDC015123]|uniref:MarR family winged helix-turn-helix transcriptional regulator n=1 Tax=Leucobacter sp. NPDC015123 TaxID=3364129 RepID=UPI0036F4AB91
MPVNPSENAAAELLAAIVGLVSNWTAAVTHGSIAAEVGVDIAEGDVRALYLIGTHGADTSTGVRPAELADELRLSRPTMSKALARLTVAGLVEKSQSATDARSITLSLTREGEAAYARLVEAGVRIVEEATAQLTPAEIRTVTGVATRLLRPETHG